jgi:hypothetical protein
MRALRFGLEILTDIVEDDSIEMALRNTARELRSTYPTPARVLGWISNCPCIIPDEEFSVLAKAGGLFRKLASNATCSDEIRRGLDVVLRNYPTDEEIDHWQRVSAIFSLKEWLLPEDYYGKKRDINS